MIDNHFLTLTPDPVWERHRKDVERMAEMSASAVFVLERDVCFRFLSPKLRDIFGFDVPADGWSPDYEFLLPKIYPEDLLVFRDIQKRLYAFVETLPAEEQTDYKHVFEFRATGKTGELVRVISQHQILDFSSQRRPFQLGTIDFSPDQNLETGLRFTLMNYRTGEIVPFAIRETPTESGLTRREIEVLELIDRGMYSKEISEALSISVHTVNRHRQNILEKTNSDNSREAINYARRLGFLS